MCLSVPVRVVAVHGPSWATVDLGGTTKRVSTDLVEDVVVGDYLLLHVGFALQKIDEEEARKTLELFEEMLRAEPEAWAGEVPVSLVGEGAARPERLGPP